MQSRKENAETIFQKNEIRKKKERKECVEIRKQGNVIKHLKTCYAITIVFTQIFTKLNELSMQLRFFRYGYRRGHPFFTFFIIFTKTKRHRTKCIQRNEKRKKGEEEKKSERE